MRKRKLRGGIAVLSLATALCLAQGVAVYAEGTDDGSTLLTADLSKGIEYRYYEGSTTRVEGINLNGNHRILRVQSRDSMSTMIRIGMEFWMKVRKHLRSMAAQIYFHIRYMAFMEKRLRLRSQSPLTGHPSGMYGVSTKEPWNMRTQIQIRQSQ